MQGLEDLDSNSTFDEVQAALTAVEAAWRRPRVRRGRRCSDRGGSAGHRHREPRYFVQNISGSDTVGDAQADVQAAAGEVVQARLDLAAGANCN